MHVLPLCGVAFGFAAVVSGQVLERPKFEPCHNVSLQVAECLRIRPGHMPVVSASLAEACLRSVPLDVETDLEYIDYLVPFIEFQSTLAFLKDPPEGYLVPGVDVMAGLRVIKERLRDGEYESQFDFVVDLKNIFVQAADGHFSGNPALLDAFIPVAGTCLASISEDGVELPKVYDLEDYTNAKNSGVAASPVQSVDGVTIQDYLQMISQLTQMQDPDAAYNSLFPNVPFKANNPGTMGDGRIVVGGYIQLPDESVLLFANGSEARVEHLAFVPQPYVFANVKSGKDLHVALELPPTKVPLGTTERSTNMPPVTEMPALRPPQVPGYPYPVAIHPQGYVAGYFLNGTGYSDTAVLAIYQFAPDPLPIDADETKATIEATRTTMSTFLARCRAANKTKLVIDVSANPGGLIPNGFEVFGQLFPGVTPYDSHNIRAGTLARVIGHAVYDIEPLSFPGPVVDEQLKPFANWSSITDPPVHAHGDNFTRRLRTNLGLFKTAGFDPNFIVQTPPVFTPENVVVVTDGACGSVCSTFVGMMQRQLGIRTLALGGRPLNLPMQAVGGAKGSQTSDFGQVAVIMAFALDAYTNKTALDEFRAMLNVSDPYSELPPLPTDFEFPRFLLNTLPPPPPPLMPLLDRLNFNLRNALLEGDETLTPTQFIYEAANCRRFYTLDMIEDPVEAWLVAHDVAWKGAKCVPGSTINADGTMGMTAPKYTSKVYTSAIPLKAPGALPPKRGSNRAKTRALARRAPAKERRALREAVKRTGFELW